MTKWYELDKFIENKAYKNAHLLTHSTDTFRVAIILPETVFDFWDDSVNKTAKNPDLEAPTSQTIDGRRQTIKQAQ